jgi:hypothetical protein
VLLGVGVVTVIERAELVGGETGVTVCIAVRGAEIVGKNDTGTVCDRRAGEGIFSSYPSCICLYRMVLQVLLFRKTMCHDRYTQISLCNYGNSTYFVEHKEIFFYKVVCPRHHATDVTCNM